MHPTRVEIRSLLVGALEDSSIRSGVEAHLRECEFCAEIADEERQILVELEKPVAELSAPETTALGERLFAESLFGMVVSLKPLTSPELAPQARIAADTSEANAPRIESLLTLFSEQPEFVLNVMRDNVAQKDYLQLSSDNPRNVSQVLVRVPQLDAELLTDSHGHADLPKQLTGAPTGLHWQVKFPTAVFDLEPIVYDPEKVEFSKEVELESDKQDRIRVTFQRKTEGTQVLRSR